MSAAAHPVSPAIPTPTPDGAAMRSHWMLDPGVVFLNHGSFGACPREVLAHQSELRERLEREPVRFMVDALEPLLDESRAVLGLFLGARSEDIAFVANATEGINAVLRSLDLRPGDELLTTSQEYNACMNALRFVAEQAGATVVTADIPFPIASAEQAVEAVLAKVGPRTRLLMISHITSPTAIILPVERLVRELAARGIDTLVDGAHAPGMIPLNLDALGAAYYTANCHKWLCSPKGAAFLHVRRDRQGGVRPLVISHGANSKRTDRSRFQLEFGWTGTIDPTAWMCVGRSIDFMGRLLPGGWPALMRRNHELALRGRDLLCRTLGATPPAPDDMLGSMASVALPDGVGPAPTIAVTRYHDPLQDRLIARGVQAPIMPWPAWPRRWVRISVQAYTTMQDIERLAAVLPEALKG